jgi:hypothetical protein
MSNELQTVDMTALVHYLKKVREIANVSKMMAPMHLKDLIEGQDVAGALLARAIQADIKAKAKKDQAESIAYLDRASDYLKERSIKDTSEARKMYICIDPDVMTATDEKAKTEALVALLKSKSSILRQAHDDLKKFIYGDSGMTGYEGM